MNIHVLIVLELKTRKKNVRLSVYLSIYVCMYVRTYVGPIGGHNYRRIFQIQTNLVGVFYG